MGKVAQQTEAQKVNNYSYGFRPGRSCHDAIRQALCYLNDGYEWVVDIDIEQFFDKVNHDKLIQILREQVNDSTTLNLCSHNQKSKRDCKRMDKLFQNRDDEAVYGRIWGVVKTQNQGHSHETMEKP